jgi:CspA family cold shock protein
MSTVPGKLIKTDKGIGYIPREGADEGIVQLDAIQGDGYRNLEEGQRVQFDVAPGRKGDEAQNVQPI